MANLIYPSNPLRNSLVDSHFLLEAETVIRHGLATSLYSEDFMGSSPYRLKRQVQNEKTFVRGWMFSPEEYKALHSIAALAGVPLATSPTAYSRAHHLNGWYELFKDFTPRTVWLSAESPMTEIVAAVEEWEDRMIVKDFVKSRKSEWDTACYIPTHEAIPTIVREFIRLQDDDGIGVQGALVLREFEDFIPERGELRCWWVNGEMVFASPHPDTPQVDFTLDVNLAEACKPKVLALDNPFITMDIAVLADGTQRIVEIGDGQVSELSTGTPANALWKALKEFHS